MSNPLRRLYKASPRLRRSARRLRNALIVAAASCALWFLGRLPLERALRVGEATGSLLYRILRKPRRLALEHLRLAFGDELTPAAREHLARASFINIARCFCELAKIDEIRARCVERLLELVDASQRARKVVLEGCGHMPQEERPEEALRLIRGFLESGR